MSYKVTVSSPAEINKTMTEECMGRTIQDVRGDSVKIKHGCRKTELQKARPRDRQLIQDRMKELRELIPNATKVELLNSEMYLPIFNCVCLKETNSVLIQSSCKNSAALMLSWTVQ
jgi:transcriptional regulator of met regulon